MDMEAWLNDNEYEGRTTHQMQELQVMLDYLSDPRFGKIQEFVSAVGSLVNEQMLNSKEVSEIFHCQGRTLGLRVLSNLPAELHNQIKTLQKSVLEWRTLRGQRKE